MIVADQKPIEQILDMLPEGKRILVVGCDTCVTVCLAGGEKEVKVLSAALRMAKKKFDGVYDADPETDPSATLIEWITHREALERGLKVMDSTALSLCMDNHLPIMVFNMTVPGNIRRVLYGERVGTLVSDDVDRRGG